MDLFQQLADNIALQHTDLLTADEEQGLVLAAGNADVGLPGLAGAVDHAAHDGNLDIKIVALHQCFHLVCQSDQVNLGPSAGRTRYDLNAAFSKSQGL